MGRQGKEHRGTEPRQQPVPVGRKAKGADPDESGGWRKPCGQGRCVTRAAQGGDP